MITHTLTINLAGKARPIKIVADHAVTTDGQILFYDERDRLIAEIPTAIIIAHTES